MTKIGGFTHKEMREIRTSGRNKALSEMRKQREKESGPLCRVCEAPLSLSMNLCTACGTVQNADAGGTK